MKILSRFDGFCSACGADYSAGDQVEWTPGKKGATHVVCPAPAVIQSADAMVGAVECPEHRGSVGKAGVPCVFCVAGFRPFPPPPVARREGVAGGGT